MKTPTNERTIGAFEGVPASALRIKDKYELDGSQPRSQKDSTRPPARPALTTASALRCLSARFSEQTADLPVPAGIFLNISGNIHTVQKSPRDCFKTRNLLAAAVDEDIHPVDHRSVKALNQSVQEGGRLALRASVRGRGREGGGRARRPARRLPRGGLEALGLAGRPVEESVGLQNQCHSCCCSPVVVGCVCRTREKERYRYKYGRERA